MIMTKERLVELACEKRLAHDRYYSLGMANVASLDFQKRAEQSVEYDLAAAAYWAARSVYEDSLQQYQRELAATNSNTQAG